MFRSTNATLDVPNCTFHPGLTNLIPQKAKAGDVEFSTSTNAWTGRSTQEPSGIELPNPNLAAYQNVLGDYAAYPLAVPLTKSAPKQLPSADLYQRATRRPWDVSHVQFAKQINKRRSFSFALAAVSLGLVYPFVAKPGMSTETGARPGFGLTSHHGSLTPAPVINRSYAA